jgi:hypothetical protein
VFWGEILGISKEIFQQDLEYAAKLSNKHRGDLAEMAFMRKAANMGFSVLKPWADSERYDFVIRAGNAFCRVQVKSVRSKSPHRQHYRIGLSSGHPYTAEQIDFVVAYIFPEDAWYVFPVGFIENRKSVCVTPNSTRSRLEQYREAWKLMEQTAIEPVAAGPVREQS